MKNPLPGSKLLHRRSSSRANPGSSSKLSGSGKGREAKPAAEKPCTMQHDTLSLGLES